MGLFMYESHVSQKQKSGKKTNKKNLGNSLYLQSSGPISQIAMRN